MQWKVKSDVVVICAGTYRFEEAMRLERLALGYGLQPRHHSCPNASELYVVTPVGVARDADRASRLIYYTWLLARRRWTP